MAEDNTQFMTSVLQKLNNAKQVSQSNNLTNIVGQQGSQIPKPNQPSTNTKNDGETGEETDRNGWQRFWDTTKDVSNKVAEGFFNVFDFLFDAGAYVVGLMGDDNFKKGVEEAMNYDWQAQALAYGEKLTGTTADIMTGDMFTADYWTDWGKIGNAEESRELINQRSEYSYQNDTAREIEQTVGSIVPSLILAYFTGGSSIGVQAASQGALAFGTSFGAGVDQALNEGADYYRAGGYGAVKGAVSGSISAATIGIGGNIASKTGSGISGKIMDKAIDKGRSMITALAEQAGFRATTAAGTAALQTAVDPFLKSIYDDGDAIEKAYGSDERVIETLKHIGTNAGNAAIFSLGMSAVRDAGAIAKAGGLEKYTQNYLDAKVFREAGLSKEYNRLSSYIKNIEKLDAQLKSGEITTDEWLQSTKALNNQFSSDLSKLQEVYDKVGQGGATAKDYANSRYAAEYKTAMSKGQDLFDMAVDRQKATAFIDVARQAGKTDTEIFNKLIKENIIKGNIKVDYQEKGKTTFTSNNLKITMKGDANNVAPQTSKEVTALIGIIENKNDVSSLPNTIQLPNRINTPLLTTENHQLISINTSVVKQLLTQYPNIQPKEVTVALQTLPKANLISPVENGVVTIASKNFTDEGRATFNVFKVDVEKHSIESMTIADAKPDNVITVRVDENGKPIGIPTHIVKGAADNELLIKQELSSSTKLVKKFKGEVQKLVSEALKGADYKVELGGTDKMGRYLFERINDPKTSMRAAKELVGNLTNFSIHDNKGNSITFDELLEIEGKNPEVYKEQLLKDVNKALSASGKETKLSKIYKVFEKNKNTISKLVEKNRESIKAGGKMNVFVNERNNARKTARMDLKWDGDAIRYNTKSLMIKPLTNIHTSGNRMSTKGFWENIEEWKANYNESNELLKVENNPRLPYSPAFREQMEILESLMPKQNPDGTYPSMSSAALEQAIRVIRMANGLEENAKVYDIETNPKARAIAKGVAKNVSVSKSNSVVKKVNEFISYEVENNATYLHQAFGNNPTINALIDSSATGYIEAQDYNLNRKGVLGKYKKEYKINKVNGIKHEIVKGVKVTNNELAYLYGFLNTPENRAELARVNKWSWESDPYKTNILSKMTLDELEEYVNKNLPDNMKEFGLHIKNLLNSEEKPLYVEKFIEDNHVDANEKEDYFFTYRLGETERSAKSKMYSVPTFGHKNSRVTNNNAFVGRDIEKAYLEYTKGMGLWLKADKPYDDFVRIMSTKVDVDGSKLTTKDYLIKTYGEKTYSRLVKYMEQCAGIKPSDQKEPTALDKGINKLTNLRIIGTLASPFASAKQGASITTSNIRMSSFFKSLGSKLSSRDAQIEYEWMKDNLPGLKNRSISDAAILGNMAGDTPFGKYSKWIDKYMMFFTRGADKITVTALAKTLPYQVEFDFGHKVGTDANREIVKQLWIDTILKQIGNTPMSKTTLSESNGFARLFFGNYQGAINAFASGVKDKIYSYIKYHNADETEINNKVDSTKVVADEAKKKLDETRKQLDETLKNKESTEEDIKVAQEQYEEDLNDFQNKQSDYEDAKNDQTGYRKYKSYSAGKKSHFFLNLGASTLVMALVLSSVDQIRKWAFGREKPQDFKIDNFLTGVLANATINQVPVLNTLYGVLANNYDLTNPGMSLFTDLIDIFKNVKTSIETGNWNNVFKGVGWFIANSSGMPLKTAYDLIYGITKTFNPETAIKMNNVLYNVSATTTAKNFYKAAEDGNDKEALSYLKYVTQERVGSTTDRVNNELYRLYQKDENALPRSYMVSYTDANGKEITLNELQRSNFKKTYSKANNLVDKLIKSSYYTSLDDSQKSYAVKYVYNAYYEYAKGNVTKQYESKAAYVLGKTSGKLNITSVASSLAYVKELKATDDKSRKELATTYVNKLQCEKGMKYLILALAGYGLGDNAKKTLQSYLVKNGMSSKDAKDFVK